jgi:hypothetical protein
MRAGDRRARTTVGAAHLFSDILFIPFILSSNRNRRIDRMNRMNRMNGIEPEKLMTKSCHVSLT